MTEFKKVALYARFSSDNQRSESIDAQIRAMKKYCQNKRYQIIEIYLDEAKSATTDKRPAFQKMIADSAKGTFDIVLVHKLDRFARNRYDSAIYKTKLKKNKVKVYSVLENIDDSPESVMLEALLEGMSEYYSKNLAREVMKGMVENALQCKHTGGKPPLGYDLDQNKKLIINEKEAEAVKRIFELYNQGYGYGQIIGHLNRQGFKTKKGRSFRKNSIYEILINEKYTGVFIYNKAESKDALERRNNHLRKNDDKIIRIENGCPQIIEEATFQKATERMIKNKLAPGAYGSREFYLLSTKMRCGICGKKMIGNLRYSGRSKSRYVSYRCLTHRSECKNKEVNKDYIDDYILIILKQHIFEDKAIKRNIQKINAYIKLQKDNAENTQKNLNLQYEEIKAKLENLTKIIERGIITDEIIQRIEDLEKSKQETFCKLNKQGVYTECKESDFRDQQTQFQTLAHDSIEFKTFIQQFIEEIIVYPYKLKIILKTGLGIADELDIAVEIKKETIYEKYSSSVRMEKSS